MQQADSVSSTDELQSRQPEKNEFRPDIEGLRAIAVLGVVLFHAAVPGISGGYVGVDVFFVISGFLITGLLWRELSSTGSVRLRGFYGARARRLLPASAAVGVITMIGSALLLPPLQTPTALNDGIASALYVSNYRFVLEGVNYFNADNLLTPSPFLHYWSLGVEEQFYLLWAPMMLVTAWLIRRRRQSDTPDTTRRPYLIVLAGVAAVSFLLSFVATYVAPAAAFYSLPTRAWQLALGGLVALTALHWRRLLLPRAAALIGWTGLAMIVLACVWFTPRTPFPGGAALLPTVGAVLLIGAGCAAPAQGAGQFLGLAPMRAIGRISYSWYLWHWPVLIFAPLIVGHPLGLAARITAALLSAGLAWLTLRLLENPLRFAPNIRASPWRSLGLGAAATALAVCVGLGLLNVVPTPIGHGTPATPVAFTAARVPSDAGIAAHDTAVRQAVAQVQAAVTTSADLNTVPPNLEPALTVAKAERDALLFDGCLREPFQSGQPECAMADTTSPTTVALVGDSHAAMWTPAFQQIADQRHWRLEMLAKAACPLLELPITNPLHHLVEKLEHCEQWRSEIVNRLRTERPRLVVLSLWRGYGTDESLTGYQAYGPAWIDGLTRLVQQLRDGGSQVLVLGPIPDPHFVVPVCLSGFLDNVAACTRARPDAVTDSGIAAEAAATKAAGGDYADTTDLFCTTDRCPVIIGNTLVYLDRNHMTLEYSRVLAPVVGALADRALADN